MDPWVILLAAFWIVAIGVFVVAAEKRARVREELARVNERPVGATPPGLQQEQESPIEEQQRLVREERQAIYKRLQMEAVEREKDEKKRRWRAARDLWEELTEITSIFPGLVPFEAQWFEGPPPAREPDTDAEFEQFDTWLLKHKLGARARKQMVNSLPEPVANSTLQHTDNLETLTASLVTFYNAVGRTVLNASLYETFHAPFQKAYWELLEAVNRILPRRYRAIPKLEEALFIAHPDRYVDDGSSGASVLLKNLFLCVAPDGPFYLVAHHIEISGVAAKQFSTLTEAEYAVMFFATTDVRAEGEISLKNFHSANYIDDPVCYARLAAALDAFVAHLAENGGPPVPELMRTGTRGSLIRIQANMGEAALPELSPEASRTLHHQLGTAYGDVRLLRGEFPGKAYAYRAASEFMCEAFVAEQMIADRAEYFGKVKYRTAELARDYTTQARSGYLARFQSAIKSHVTPQSRIAGPPCMAFSYEELAKYVSAVAASGYEGTDEIEYCWIAMTLMNHLIREWQCKGLVGMDLVTAAYETSGLRLRPTDDTQDILRAFYGQIVRFLERAYMPVLGSLSEAGFRYRPYSTTTFVFPGEEGTLEVPPHPFPASLREPEPRTVVFERDELRVYYHHPTIYPISYKGEIIGCLDADLFNDEERGKVVVQVETDLTLNGWGYTSIDPKPLRGIDPTMSPDLSAWMKPEDFAFICERAYQIVTMMESRGMAPFEGAKFEWDSLQAA